MKFIPLFKNRAGFSPVAANAPSIGAALVMIWGRGSARSGPVRRESSRLCCVGLAAIALMGLAWAAAA